MAGRNILPADFEEKLVTRLVTEGVVTHFGPDLDSRMAVEALRRRFGLDKITVEYTAAGQPREGRINIDVGDSTCTEPIKIDPDTNTVIIDHHFARKPDGTQYRNTLEILRDYLGIYIPNQLIELADQPVERNGNPLEWRTPLSLSRYLSDQQIWEFAEKGLLTQQLTDGQLKEHGIEEAAKKQKQVIDDAVRAVQAGVIPGTKFVVVDRFVPAGSMVAYHLGYDVYVSVQEHEKGGYTFAATARPGTRLPGSFIEWAEQMREKYGSGIFIKPDGTMVVAGGPKNPDFSVPCDPDELIGALLKDEKLKQVLDETAQKTSPYLESTIPVSAGEVLGYRASAPKLGLSLCRK